MRYLQRRQQRTFIWGFNNVTDINLPECGTVSLALDTTQLSGQQPSSAPYSLVAYPAQGLPSTYPLSLTGTTAPWTVNYPAGTRLLFNIADASGNSGGVPAEIYTVQSGESKECLPSTSTPAVTMKIYEPSVLSTCTVLLIQIEGGQKPYTVTLAVANSVAPSNRTLGSDHDMFAWVNQSPPNSTLILAVSDSKGQYALASKLFTTSGGSTDVSCPGQSSRSYNSNTITITNTNTNNNDSSGNIVTATSTINTDSNNNNINNPSNNYQKAQIPIAGIIAGGLLVVFLIALVILVVARCRPGKKGRKGGVRLFGLVCCQQSSSGRRRGWHRTTAHQNTSAIVHQNHVLPMPPDTESSAAHSNYEDNPPIQKTSLYTSSVPTATIYQQVPEDRQRSTSSGVELAQRGIGRKNHV